MGCAHSAATAPAAGLEREVGPPLRKAPGQGAEKAREREPAPRQPDGGGAVRHGGGGHISARGPGDLGQVLPAAGAPGAAEARILLS